MNALNHPARPPSVPDVPSMPMASPSYPRGPYRFAQREYLIVTYASDPDAIRAALPPPLEPDGSGDVLYEFIRMPDSAGFGDYTESGVVIPALFQGKPVNFTAQMYLDDQPPIAGGREIWGFPKSSWPTSGCAAPGPAPRGCISCRMSMRPVADLPVRRIVGGLHFIADLTLPYGRVIHDYLAT